jgi:hypothetical protein
MRRVKIDSWHENGNSIWFFIKGIEKSYVVPKEYIQSCQINAVDDFKKKFISMFDI